VSFVAEDVDETSAHARSLGGSVLAEPFDAPPVGRVAVLADAHGVTFAIITPPPSRAEAGGAG